ncbi:ATP synthase F0 subunit B [Mycoplasma sp. ATU-Cv-508]
MYSKRRRYIQDNIDESEKQLEKSRQSQVLANEELLHARNVAHAIISDAKKEAQRLKLATIEEAKDQADSLLEKAKVSIEKAREEFYSDAQKAVVDLAIDAAKKVIGKEMDSPTNRKLVEEFIGKK